MLLDCNAAVACVIIPNMASSNQIARGHWVPFAAWIGVMLLLQALEMFGACPRWLYPVSYGAKSLICAGLLLYYKPWRYNPGVRAGDWPVAVLAGVGVAALWIIPEMPETGRWLPAFQAGYHRWLIFPWGRFPSYFDPSVFPALPFNHRALAFSPAEAGWPLVVLKLLGSAAVIAVIEEYFFRGFLYRWIRNPDFSKIPLGRYDAQAFWMIVVIFGLEHDRWLAGMLAGAVYGWLAVRAGRVAPAIIAHVVTNLVLGIYVIVSGQYGFW
jgi:membrane protease YdiL (CAAX protease family)